MLILSFFVLFVFAVAEENDPHPLSDEYIERINTQQNLWKAGRNFPENTPLENLSALLGTFLGGLRDGFTIKTHDADVINSLPESFDSREKWQNCLSLNEIRDQGVCGSCWAVGAVEAMTDRWCIHSNGSQFHFSAEDMAGCVTACHGCHGGHPGEAWDFWITNGVVSGGNYDSKQGCRPYEMPNCIHDNSPDANCTNSGVAHCVDKCQDDYDVSYEQDKRFGSETYHVKGEDHIKAELYLNGPLQASFMGCPDLFHYKSGVYKSKIDINDRRCRGHSVKLLGWGIENGTKYWLLANSWNNNWGELGGFFKFLRGENHMHIENEVLGGMPKF